jgi:hypothetical protein
VNLAEFDTEIKKTIRRAIETGIAVDKPKMTIDEAVGCLARHQHTLLNIDAGIRQQQAAAIHHALANQQAATIVAAPPGLDVKGGVK